MKEVTFEEGIELIEGKAAKIIWLGSEPVGYVSRLLDCDETKLLKASINEILDADSGALGGFEGMIFMCYHGVTSGLVVDFLESRGVSAYNLKGGITSVVGEIF